MKGGNEKINTDLIDTLLRIVSALPNKATVPEWISIRLLNIKSDTQRQLLNALEAQGIELIRVGGRYNGRPINSSTIDNNEFFNSGPFQCTEQAGMGALIIKKTGNSDYAAYPPEVILVEA